MRSRAAASASSYLPACTRIDRGIGRLGELVVLVRLACETGKDLFFRAALLEAACLSPFLAPDLLLGKGFLLGSLVFRLTALLVFLTAAAVAGIIASGFGHVGQCLGTKGFCPLYSALPANATFH